jgi:hypothetical protein
MAHVAAGLAAPAVAFENLAAELPVALWIQFHAFLPIIFDRNAFWCAAGRNWK